MGYKTEPKVKSIVDLIDGSWVVMYDTSVKPTTFGGHHLTPDEFLCNVVRFYHASNERIWRMQIPEAERFCEPYSDTMVHFMFNERGDLFTISFHGRLYRIDWKTGQSRWVGESRFGEPAVMNNNDPA